MMDKLQKFCVISLTQGGRHADNTVDLQEFMIMPTGAENMEQAIRMCIKVYNDKRIEIEWNFADELVKYVEQVQKICS